MNELTEAETEALKALVIAWNKFAVLPSEHMDDFKEFRHGIHILQDKILARPMRRVINSKPFIVD